MKGFRSTLIALLLTTSFVAVQAQESASDDQSRQEKRAIKKEQKRELAKTNLLELSKMAEDRSIVLEATTLRGRSTLSVEVFEDNFIKIDEDQFVLQTVLPNNIGPNGIGGMTANGTITDYKANMNAKRGLVTVIANVDSHTLGQGTLTIKMNSAGYSKATFVNNMGKRITFIGSVESVENAEVYKGLRI